MRFGDMRDRIILLKPGYSFVNEMNETVPAWVPFCPFKPELKDNPPILTVTEGYAAPLFDVGKTLKDAEKYAVWANAKPTTGREYEEAQKIRAETTWKIKLRYTDTVASDFKVLHRGHVLNIESILDVEGQRRELTLVCSEVDTYGKGS